MQGIKTYIDGQRTKMSDNPKTIDGYAMVPMEEIYYKLGIPKQWDDNPQKLVAVKNSSILN